MAYVLPDPIPWADLVPTLSRADDLLARLDERLARSPIREGWISRVQFADACASLWLAGDLVHLEDLVLHDAGMDVRSPTREVVQAHGVLQARRRLAAAAPGTLRPASLAGAGEARAGTPPAPLREAEVAPDEDPLAPELAALDRALTRARRVMEPAGEAERGRAAPFVYDPDRQEDESLAQWSSVREAARHLPPLLAAAIAHDAWGTLEPLEHRGWVGPLVIADDLRAGGRTRHHLLAIHSALRLVPRERRQSRHLTTRIVAFLDGVAAVAELGMKEHDRWLLARRGLERKLAGRRSTSHLPALIDLMLARPVVSAGLVAAHLRITPRAAHNLVAELGVREVTGRGRYRAWGVL